MKESRRGKNIILRGKSISSGYAIGKAFLYKDVLSRDLRRYRVDEEQVEEEISRLKEVFDDVLRDIRSLEKNIKGELGKEQSDIFNTHAEILKDKALTEEIEDAVRYDLINAERAVKKVFRRWADKFRSSENEAIKSRAEDMEDIARRVLCSFMECDTNILEKVRPDSILVARRLLPSDTVNLKRKNVRGIIVEQGSGFSHTAIIARTLGIPAVSDIENAFSVIKPGEKIIVDGHEGALIREASGEDIEKYKKLEKAEKKNESDLIVRAKGPARTASGQRVKVYANIASAEDIRVARSRGYDGIGLLRIEHMYMSSKILPDEKRLTKQLYSILKGTDNSVVTLRMLDIGADKNLPYLDIENEPSPVLGMRGVRLLIKYENLLETQLKAAILLAGHYNIRVLVPMVTFPEEMEKVRDVEKRIARSLRIERGSPVKRLKIGAMIETPAAVENINSIARVSDFLSVGTNDLIQYAVAAGRDNPSVQDYYEKGAELALKYMKKITKAARTRNLECGVCGEMAGDARWIKPLIRSGVRSLSVSPYLIPVVKEKISGI